MENKKVNIIKDGEHIFTGILKQSLSLEYYVVIDDENNDNRFKFLKADETCVIEPYKSK